MATLPVGTLVAGKFRIFDGLGRAGMGTVYVAEQLSVSRPVALKVMRLPTDATRDEADTFEKRFFLEASLCAKLAHPNVVTMFDYGEVGRRKGLAQRWCSEGSQATRLKQLSPVVPNSTSL
jgi:serine/threonine protein kinase